MANAPTTNDSNGDAQPPARAASAMVLIGSDPYRGALEPRTVMEAVEFAEDMASSGMFGLKSRQEALAKVMYGRNIGITAVQSLQCLHSIEGKIGMEASLMQALCLRATNICEYFEPLLSECSNEKAVCVAKRVGRPEQRFEFTIEDAKLMGVLDRGRDEAAKKKNNWNTSPRDMLLARCKSKLARQVFPDITHGMYTAEELYDALPDPDEMVGEVVQPVPVNADVVRTVMAEKRDYAKEADAMIARLEQSTTKTERAAVRGELDKWDGIEPHRARVKDAYNKAVKAAEAQKAKEKEGGAQANAPAAADAPKDAPQGSAANPGPMPEGSLFGNSDSNAGGK